jgi:hypothetical protein
VQTGVNCLTFSEVKMIKRCLRFVGILVAAVLIATVLIVLVEMTGVNVVALAE